MVMIELYENEKEKSRHDSAIRMLARDLGLPTTEIGELYEGALQELKKSAKVKDYLIILAARQVKDLLQGRRGRAA